MRLNDNGIALVQKSYDCVDGIMIETVFVHESGEMLETGILRFPIMQDTTPRRNGVFDLCPPRVANGCLRYCPRR
jgi:hypothetical protein